MTTVLGVIGVLVVLFAAAAVALRDEAVLVDAPRDGADLALPGDGPMTAGDLERVRFGMVLRGYRMAQVDAVLDRVAGELIERDEQLAALSSEVDRLRARGPERSAADATGRDVDGPGLDDEADPEEEPVTEPPVEHVPDSGESAEPLPGVTTRPEAQPPAPVPFEEPVRTDQPVRAPKAPDDNGAIRRPAPDRAVAKGPAVRLARRLGSRLASARRSG